MYYIVLRTCGGSQFPLFLSPTKSSIPLGWSGVAIIATLELISS